MVEILNGNLTEIEKIKLIASGYQEDAFCMLNLYKYRDAAEYPQESFITLTGNVASMTPT